MDTTDTLAMVTLNSKQQLESAGDDSWVRTPPGGPVATDNQTAMDLDRIAAEGNPAKASRAFALDDLEAAETLAGFARQSPPPAKSPPNASSLSIRPSNPTSRPPPEPLLSLLTSQHPLIGTAINGSLSAYNIGKNYSSQFRHGAEFVERNIASPVATTVGTAGRITGVENGVRRWLSRGRPVPAEAASDETSSASPDPAAMSPSSSNASHKRRRAEPDTDLETPHPVQRSRATSEISVSQGEFLPAYDTNRSPSYSSRDPYPPLSPTQHSLGNSTWQTRLILSTSGLGVAMSGESRRSLKYCLRWLRWGNGRLGRLVYSLQTLLAEYEAAGQRRGDATGASSSRELQPRDQDVIMDQLAALRAECERVLKKSVDVVSNYTGGALPENARALVHRHLTSLPQRFAFALRGEPEALLEADGTIGGSPMHVDNSDSPPQSSSLENTESPRGPSAADESENQRRRDVIRAAKRMVVLAREGLEMMGQVSVVVDSTLTSAEEWCERLGRRVPEGEADATATLEGHEPVHDELDLARPALPPGTAHSSQPSANPPQLAVQGVEKDAMETDNETPRLTKQGDKQG